jgi:2-polyprenyl-6-methoxyphenol hydroxylase-like FAD-dependent oxidoreductase
MDAAERSFELGVFYHNPFSFWSRPVKDSKAMVVLCGDAAHAVPPFLGQGANQAIQDAYCLARKIAQYNERVKADEDCSLPSFLFDYQLTRWPGTFSIFWQSLFLGYLETGGPNGLYSNFRNIFFKTTGFLGVAQRVLLGAAIPKLK